MLSLSLVPSDEMAEMNLKFRGKQGPTNVLSFSQKEGDEQNPNPDLLGDVVICADRAADDAADLGYTNEEMIVYLLIHGVLHLMGVHHDRPEEAEEMRARVDALFNEMFPPEG
jgi:probable rRNA maturation factor